MARMGYADWLMAAEATRLTPSGHSCVGALVIASAELEAIRRSGAADVVAVLAGELAYDQALISLSRHAGVDTGPERFEVPERERDRLHRALVEALPALPEAVLAEPWSRTMGGSGRPTRSPRAAIRTLRKR